MRALLNYPSNGRAIYAFFQISAHAFVVARIVSTAGAKQSDYLLVSAPKKISRVLTPELITKFRGPQRNSRMTTNINKVFERIKK